MGREHPDYLTALGNVGAYLDDLGRHQEAVTTLEEALAAYLAIAGEDDPRPAMVHGKVGKKE